MYNQNSVKPEIQKIIIQIELREHKLSYLKAILCSFTFLLNFVMITW